MNCELRNTTFRRGLPSDGEATSGFFKLQKIRTEEKFVFRNSQSMKLFFYLLIIFTIFFSSQTIFALATVPSSADCAITAFLKVGFRGAEVRCLQGKIGVAEDGIFGPLTKAAVIVFQSSHGLAADGIVGSLSRTALNNVAANDNIYPVGCAGIAGYSITTGVKCDIGALVSLLPTVNNNAPDHPVVNNIQPSQKSSAGMINNTKDTNPNLVNLDRLIKTVVDVNRKNGFSEKDLELMANALREEVVNSKINYNEEFKKMLIREASLSFNTQSFSTVFNKVAARTLSFLGIIPSVAEAALIDNPFGGALLDSVFCVLSGNWMITLEPLPPNFVALLSYYPGTQGFATYNIPFTSYLLGSHSFSGVCILSRKATIPTQGTITPMVGSSPL